MGEPGKPKFGAFESLALNAKSDMNSIKAHIPESEKTPNEQQETHSGLLMKEKDIEKNEQKKARITKPVLTNEIENEVRRLATVFAERATMEKLYGKRVTYKGPRVTRSYKIEILVDKWLDAISNETGIEKSMMVTKAIKEYISKDYLHLKPIEDEFSEA